MSASTAPSIQYSWDGPGTLGAGQDALYLRWNNTTGRFEMASAGVSAHSGLSGLTSGDDHTQYALLAGRSGGQTLVGDTASGGGLTLTSTSHATKGPITMSGASKVIAPAGTAAAPGLILGDSGTGLTRLASNCLSVATNGSERVRFTDAAITIINPTTTPFTPEATTKQAMVLRMLAGQTASPFEVQSSAGTALSGTDAGGRVFLPDGTAGSPSFYFLADSNTGLYRSATDRIGVSLGGVNWHTLGAAFASFMNQTTFSTNVAATTPVIVRGAASQTANLQEWQNSASAVLASINSAGGVTAPALLVATTAAGSVVARMRGFTSQTADLLQFQDVGATVLSSVDAAGRFLAPAGSAAAPALAFAGDTDTGIYRAAANYLSIATAGAERVRFTDAAITIINPTTTPFTPEATTKQAMVLKLLAGQTANAIEVQSSAGTALVLITAAGQYQGRVGFSMSTSGGSVAGSIDTNTANTMRFVAGASTEIIKINTTGIGFFGVTPVARPTALTAADAGALNTGDAGSDTVIGNMRTRIGELETKLQALGLLT